MRAWPQSQLSPVRRFQRRSEPRVELADRVLHRLRRTPRGLRPGRAASPCPPRSIALGGVLSGRPASPLLARSLSMRLLLTERGEVGFEIGEVVVVPPGMPSRSAAGFHPASRDPDPRRVKSRAEGTQCIEDGALLLDTGLKAPSKRFWDVDWICHVPRSRHPGRVQTSPTVSISAISLSHNLEAG